jgi:hypothetical protein
VHLEICGAPVSVQRLGTNKHFFFRTPLWARIPPGRLAAPSKSNVCVCRKEEEPGGGRRMAQNDRAIAITVTPSIPESAVSRISIVAAERHRGSVRRDHPGDDHHSGHQYDREAMGADQSLISRRSGGSTSTSPRGLSPGCRYRERKRGDERSGSSKRCHRPTFDLDKTNNIVTGYTISRAP